MKKLFSTVAALILAANLWAGVPQGFSFQAVVRNAQGELVQNNANVSVKVSILKDAADDNSAVYAETATATTNANGLLSLQIGAGTPVEGSFEKIDWAQGPLFIKTEIDIEGGENYSISSVQQLLSVPFAMYAGNVPTKVSELENDAKFVSTDTLKAYAANINILKNTIMLANYVNADTLANYVNADTLANYVNAETLANYVSTKTLNSYAKTDQNISSFNNDANYVTSSTLKSYAKNNQNISSFNNDAKYISEDTLNVYAKTDALKDTLSYYALKSELPDGVDLSTYLHNGSNISNLNNDAKYVKEGENISKLNNDAKYLTKSDKIDNAAIADSSVATYKAKRAEKSETATKATQYIGDMPLVRVTVIVNGSEDNSMVKFLGKEIKEGENTFVIPAYSPVYISAFPSSRQYVDMIDINGEEFNNIAGYADTYSYSLEYKTNSYSNYGDNHYYDYYQLMCNYDPGLGNEGRGTGFANKVTSSGYLASNMLMKKYFKEPIKDAFDYEYPITMKAQFWSEGGDMWADGLKFYRDKGNENGYNPLFVKIPVKVLKSNIISTKVKKVTAYGDRYSRGIAIENQIIGPFPMEDNTITITFVTPIN